MEPEWAAVELLSYFEEELNPNRGDAQNASQAMLNAIRVLPAPVAGDVFVTCAARGNIGVILFYSEEGESSKIDVSENSHEALTLQHILAPHRCRLRYVRLLPMKFCVRIKYRALGRHTKKTTWHILNSTI